MISSPEPVTALIEERLGNEANAPVLKRYERGQCLGKGGWAVCYEMKDIDTGVVMAGKVIDTTSLSPRLKQKLTMEIGLHKTLQHVNIVRLFNHFQIGPLMYMLLELCPNKTLNELVQRRGRLQELEVQYYLRQVVLALTYIHGQHVVHRDIKLNNVFIGRNLEAKLGDFGLAVKLRSRDERRKSVCGTPNYMAPEVLTKSYGYSYAADVWSLGVMVYAMLVGSMPFSGENNDVLYRNIQRGQYRLPLDVQLSQEANDLLAELLDRSPATRLSLAQILNHPFLTKNLLPRQLPLVSLDSTLPESFIRHYAKSPRHVVPQILLTSARSLPYKLRLCSAEPSQRAAQERPKDASEERLTVQPRESVKKPLGNAHKHVVTLSYAAPVSGALNVGYEFNTQKQTHFRNREGDSQLWRSPGNKSLGSYRTHTEEPCPHLVLCQKTQTASRREPAPMNAMATNNNHIYAIFFIDLSSKYGLGYVLTNGHIGFYYNDKTTLLWMGREQGYAYSVATSPTSEGKLAWSKIPAEAENDADDPELQNKFVILNMFRGLYERNVEEGKSPKASVHKQTADPTVVMIQGFAKSPSGTLFRLSHNVVHMAFLDKTHMLLYRRTKVIAFVNTAGAIKTIQATSENLAQAGDEILMKYKTTLDFARSFNTRESSADPQPKSSRKTLLSARIVSFSKGYQLAHAAGKKPDMT